MVRLTRRLVGPAVLLALTAVWWVTLRPATLGGPAAVVVVSGHSMEPALSPGTLVVARRRDDYAVGDVIVYRVPKGDPAAGVRVIHRVVGGSPSAGYVTRGDNRRHPDHWRPRPHDIEGAELAAVPGVGRAMMLLGTPLAIGVLLALLVFVWAGEHTLPRRLRRAPALPPVVAAPPAPAPVAARPAPRAVSPPRPASRPLASPTPRRRHGAATAAAAIGGVAAAALVARGLRRR